MTKKIEIEITNEQAELLAVLSEKGDVADVLTTVAHHVSQGVARPGAWERQMVESMFAAGDWEERLEEDPDSPWRRRPAQRRGLLCTVCGRELDRDVARGPGDGDRCQDCDEEIPL